MWPYVKTQLRNCGLLSKTVIAGPVLPNSRDRDHTVSHAHAHQRGRGRLDDVHTRSSPRSFHAPNPLSSIHPTIFTIRHPSQHAHTVSNRQWLNQPEVRFCHLQSASSRAEHSFKVQGTQSWEAASSFWRRGGCRGWCAFTGQNAMGRRRVAQL